MNTETIVDGFTSVNPTTEEEIREYEYMTMSEALQTVENCHKALRTGSLLLWKLALKSLKILVPS